VIHTKRRKFLLTTGALLAAPLSARAQQPKVPRIAVLVQYPLAARKGSWDAFREGLRDSGYVEGQNIVIEWRSAEGKYERLPALAMELIRAKVDVIVTAGSETVLAASKATKTIPIVMATVGDPVGIGVVASLGRPGGNVTGLSLFATEISAKRLDLLRDTLPNLARVAIVWNPDNASVVLKFKAAESAARAMGLKVQSLETRRLSELEVNIPAAAKEGANALFTEDDGVLLANRTRLIELATKFRLPVVSEFKEIVDAGGLWSYGPDIPAVHRRAAAYVAKILKGAKPAELPVEQPSKFELVVNLKSAKTLGLTIPQPLLVRADVLIQ
jgi:putative tryptophan/tyrosine transport system substrate-binding protein